MGIEHFDVVVVGAGLSGVGAGWHLQHRCPDRSYVILESRAEMGGTWDLFRYPGIRSDSDMHTLGYSFRPWTEEKAIADGRSILNYIRDTAREYGIDRHIRYQHRVVQAEWSSDEAIWLVETEAGESGERKRFSCRFLYMCSGYYNYAKGHAPDFAGSETFKGQIIHPQFWPEQCDYAGKRIVVIGSGATAVTLVPELARDAGHVTMLQRSPTYIVARPAQDKVANWLRGHLPRKLAYGVTRWKNVLLQQFFYRLARKKPEKAKERLIGMVRDALGPDHDVDTHFTPSYHPWDQRLCLIPDADMFDAIREGRASVETGHIERFTENGILLKSGKLLEADMIVTATGLELQLMGGAEISVDGHRVNPAERLNYKGLMLSDVPNMAFCFGYTNASWTLKADLSSAYMCRLLNTMKTRGLRQCTPRFEGKVDTAPLIDFSSGYVRRALDRLPKQGTVKPWRLHQNYLLDLLALRYGSVDDHMAFSNPVPEPDDSNKKVIAA
ncbi:NAD(P)/FAD-dependent oxidoreductase [Stakelama sediminis]|uniref:Cation diffusion facilitator CzcD-associated flavoprotein CzcO n=1 Tax=Stakelama sediminis TaxID=463200 RepID=A0A840YYS7_9SPHN|nr:NAD(P)/FAD-dependent oxidoreductase [Stakelama sediminis]MBB5718689.1 cation diffusion facilitator CzcD-associated flavoprotein CzcO [Stakelama sediminis]